MWRTLGTLKEGLQEFSRDALRETNLLRPAATTETERAIPAERERENSAGESKAGARRLASSRAGRSPARSNAEVAREPSSFSLDEHDEWEGQKNAGSPAVDGDSGGWENLNIDTPLSPLADQSSSMAAFTSPKVQSLGAAEAAVDTSYDDGLMGPIDLLERQDRSQDAGSEAHAITGNDTGGQVADSPMLSESQDGSKPASKMSPAGEKVGQNRESSESEKVAGERRHEDIATSGNVQAQSPPLVEPTSEGGAVTISEGVAPPKASVKADAVKEARLQAKKDRAELERLSNLCAYLRSSLEEELVERTKLKEELVKYRNQKRALEAQVEELESAAVDAAKMAEEELQAAQNDYQKLQDRAMAAEAKAAASRKEREALEAKVKAITASLEKRMTNLQSELQARQKEVERLQEDNATMESSFSELRNLLKEAVDERDGLMEGLAERDKLVEEMREDLERARMEAEAACREAAETSVALAEAAAQKREAAMGQMMGEEERLQLEGSVKAAIAAAEAAKGEAAELKEKCVKLEMAARARGRALAQAEAELAMAQERALAAEGEADEAKRGRAEAEGNSEQLREQTERRAKLFNAAVKAAVSKIKSELEGERDEALFRIRSLEAESAAHIEEMRSLQEHAQSLVEELEAVNSSLKVEEEEKKGLQRKVGEMEKDMKALQRREEEALAAGEAARDVSNSLATKISALDEQCRELRAEVEAVQSEAETKRAAWEAERVVLAGQLTAADREKISLKVAGHESSSEAHSLRQRVAELEGRLTAAESRAVRLSEAARHHGMDKVTSRTERSTSALADLELDTVRVGLRDLESSNDALLESKGKRPYKRDAPASWTKRQQLDDHDRMPGRISRRTFLLGLYIMLLHIIVMVSFTHRSNPCSSGDIAKALPDS